MHMAVSPQMLLDKNNQKSLLQFKKLPEICNLCVKYNQ